jgi:hypothetical protein
MSLSTRIMWSDDRVFRVALVLIVVNAVDVAAVNESHLMLLSERRMPERGAVEETNPDGTTPGGAALSVPHKRP